MALDTYVNLQAAVADWLNRADLSARIPDFIALVESDLRTELQTRVRVRSTALTVAGEQEILLPVDCKQLTSLSVAAVDGSTIRPGPIDITTPELVDYYVGIARTPGRPRYGAVIADGTRPTLILAPVPDQVYTLNLVYDALIVPLSNDAPTNWVLTNHPNVYLYGALMHSAPFIKDDERMALWAREYAAGVEKLRLDRERLEYGTNTLVARPKRPIGG